MRALLDVNVLIALLDGAHVHHNLAMNWLRRELSHGWASCPITQNGCVRIMSQPSYPQALAATAVADRLAEAANTPDHIFWPDDVNALERGTLEWTRILGHRQVTDAYLLALAVRHEGRLVSFDKRISIDAVRFARDEHLVVLV